MKVNKCFGFAVPALLTVVLVVLMPKALFGGLGDKVKAEAAKINTEDEAKNLSNAVMKEIDRKIADAVAEKPISETDKANIKKKLSSMARSKVKKLIDAAVSDKLPERAELLNTVMKEILPQVDGFVTEIVKAERSQNTTAPPPSTPPAPPAPQVKSHIVVVYVTGDSDVVVEIKKSVRAGLLNAIVTDKQYIAAKNDESFLAEADSISNTQIDNTVYDDQISKIGVKFGIRFVYTTEITTTFDAFHILVRMIDVQTAEAVAVGNAVSPLKSDEDIAVVSGELVKKIIAGQVVTKTLSKTIKPTKSRQDNEPDMHAPVSQSQQPALGTAPRISIVDPPPPVRPEEPEDGKHTSMTGFSLGYGLSLDAKSNSSFLQLGFVHSRPIFEKIVSVSVNVEGNLWFGIGEYEYKRYNGSDYDYADSSFNFFGANVPVTISLQWSVFSLEAGLFGDAVFVDSEIFYNAGFVIGSGVVFDKKRARWYFYKYNSGYNYGTHAVGLRWLF